MMNALLCFPVVCRYPMLILAFFALACSTACTDHKPAPVAPVVPPPKLVVIDFITPAPGAQVVFNDTLTIETGSRYPELTLNEVSYFIDGNPVGKGDSTLMLRYPLTHIKGGRHMLEVSGTYSNGETGSQRIFFHVVSDIKPAAYDYETGAVFPHDRMAFTQGLEINEGWIYEGTGLTNGKSTLRKADLFSGTISKMITLNSEYFGEGITVWEDKVYQLTYQNGKCFVYHKSDLSKITEYYYSGEGWGLTHDDQQLIMSDGTAQIRFIDPNNFNELGRITVFDDKGEVNMLNELEYIDGEIFANIYQTHKIARIDPVTGKVMAYIYLNNLLPRAEWGRVDVLNGIAVDPISKRLYVTGKLWPSLFEIKLKLRQPDPGK